MKSRENDAHKIGYFVGFSLTILVIWILAIALVIVMVDWFNEKAMNESLKNQIQLRDDSIASLELDVYFLTDQVDELNFELEAIRALEADMMDALGDATFDIETWYGKSSLWVDYNNAGGIKCGSDFCHYDTPQEGLDALGRLLHHYVYDLEMGFDLERIRTRYCYQCGEDDLATFIKFFKEEVYE